MSNALNYLIKARPEAMGSYFKFLKEAGQHLDPKTRDLISVITKVAVQTEPGFRQYLSRALRDGCTANEVLDALLMAFPVLGLAKIVWATEILLDMDIPEFHPEMLDETPRWHDIATLEEMPMGQTSYFNCDGRSVFVFRTDEQIHVYDSRCPHQVTNIPELSLEEHKLTCPKHNWAFDIESGECIEKGNRPLRRFDTWVEGTQLLAFW